MIRSQIADLPDLHPAASGGIVGETRLVACGRRQTGRILMKLLFCFLLTAMLLCSACRHTTVWKAPDADLTHTRTLCWDTGPGDANAVAPGKRPYNTIIPGFITRHGQAWSSYGVMGGFILPKKWLHPGLGNGKEPASSKVLVYSCAANRNIRCPGEQDMGGEPLNLNWKRPCLMRPQR